MVRSRSIRGRPTRTRRRRRQCPRRAGRSTPRPMPMSPCRSTPRPGCSDQPAHPRRLQLADRGRARRCGHHAEQLGWQPVDPVQLRDRPRVEPRRRLRVPQHQLRRHRRRGASFPRYQRRGRRAEPPRCADARLGRAQRRRRDLLVPGRGGWVPAGERGRQLPQRRPRRRSEPGQHAEHAGGRPRLGRRARRRRQHPRHRRHGQRAGAVGHQPLRRPPGVPDVRGDPRQVPDLRPPRARGQPGQPARRSGDVLLVRLLGHRTGAGGRIG